MLYVYNGTSWIPLFLEPGASDILGWLVGTQSNDDYFASPHHVNYNTVANSLTFWATRVSLDEQPTSYAQILGKYGTTDGTDRSWVVGITDQMELDFTWVDSSGVSHSHWLTSGEHDIQVGDVFDLRVEFEPQPAIDVYRLRFYINNILLKEFIGTTATDVDSTTRELRFMRAFPGRITRAWVTEGLPPLTRDNYEWVIKQRDGGSDIHVATTGNDTTGNGSQGNPYASLERAYTDASPGDTILVHGGTYAKGVRERFHNLASGTPLDWIIVKAAGDGAVTIDGTGTSSFQGAIEVSSASYIAFMDLEVFGAEDHAFRFQEGAHHIAAVRCIGRDGGDTGFELIGSTEAGSARYCYMEDCEGYNNQDPGASNADGFGGKHFGGDGHTFIGCVAHHNSDDGFDVFRANYCTLIECEAYDNGKTAGGTGTAGDGVGFKIGGPGGTHNSITRTAAQQGGHRIARCLAWSNNERGFDSNGSAYPSIFENCTGYANPTRNFSVYDGAHEIRNSIGFSGGTNFIETADGVVSSNNSWNLGDADPSFASTTYGGEDFLRPTSVIYIDAGTETRVAYSGSAPDVGAVELTQNKNYMSELIDLNVSDYNTPTFLAATTGQVWTPTGEVSVELIQGDEFKKIVLGGGSGSYISTTDDVLGTPVGDFEFQMRFKMSDTGSGPRALLACPNPWTFWSAIRGSTDAVEFENTGAGSDTKAIVSGWTAYDQDVTIRITRSSTTYTVSYRFDDYEAWTTLGSDTANPGDATTLTVYLGAASDVGEDTWAGDVHYAKFWVGGDSTTGTLRFDMNPSRDATIGETTWVSSTTGETWGIGGNTSLVAITPGEVTGLSGTAGDGTTTLDWTESGTIDYIRIYRDNVLEDTLNAGVETWTSDALNAGIYTWKVVPVVSGTEITANSDTILFENIMLANIYVATSGNDTTGDGSEGNPYATITKALDVASPGDVIEVANGAYVGQFLTTESGTDGSPITIRAANRYRARLDGNDGTTGLGYVWECQGNWLVIDGFEITNGRYNGIYNRGSNNIIQNCWIHDLTAPDNNGGNGGAFIAEHSTTSSNNIYRNNICHGNVVDGGSNQTHGIYVHGDGAQVYNNIVGKVSARAIQVFEEVDNVLVANNLCFSGIHGLIINGDNNTVINNIFSDFTIGIESNKVGATGNTFSHNHFWNVTSNFTTSASETNSNASTGDPGLVSYADDGTGDYNIASSGSAIVNSGTNTNAPTVDMVGNPRVGTIDKGPIELGSQFVNPSIPSNAYAHWIHSLNPVIFFRMADSGTTMADETGTITDGTHGIARLEAAPIPTSVGAHNYQGDHESPFTSPNALNSPSFTTAVWYQPGDTWPTQRALFTAFQGTSFVNGHNVWLSNTNRKIEFYTGTGSNGVHIDGLLNLDSPNRIVVTHDSGTSHLYINGVEAASASITFSPSSGGQPWEIGGENGSAALDGLVWDVAFFDYAWDSTIVADDYARGIAETYGGWLKSLEPIAFFRLADNGTTMTDVMGNVSTGAHSASSNAAPRIASSIGAHYYNGSTDSTFTSLESMEVGSFTTVAWFELESTPVSNASIFNGFNAGFTKGHQLWISGTSDPLFYRGNGTTTTFLNGGDIPASTPIRAVMTHDGSTSRLYLNGVEVASNGLANYVPCEDGTVWEIGSENGSSYYRGWIWDIALFDYVWDVDLVEEDYARGTDS